MSYAKIDPALHQARKPPWIKVRLPSNPVFFSTKALISDLRLHTRMRILRGDDCETVRA
jgi:lipoic acid synthetase